MNLKTTHLLYGHLFDSLQDAEAYNKKNANIGKNGI